MNFFEMSPTGLRGHKYKILLVRTKSKQRLSFITNRTINLWNSLPADIVETKSVGLFKDKLMDYSIQENNNIWKLITSKYNRVVD